MRNRYNPYLSSERESRFLFRRDNRRLDGLWDAEDATDDNIKGTSVDRHDPVWPRWKKTPPLDTDGEFVSDEPFFDIDEITQTAKFYPPGTPLVDRNLDGNPATRQRVRDFLTGNHWRRRLLVGRPLEGAGERQTQPAGHLSASTLRSTPGQRLSDFAIEGADHSKIYGSQFGARARGPTTYLGEQRGYDTARSAFGAAARDFSGQPHNKRREYSGSIFSYTACKTRDSAAESRLCANRHEYRPPN